MGDAAQEQKEQVKVKFVEVGNRKGSEDIDLGPSATLKDLLDKQGVSADRQVRVNATIVSNPAEYKLEEGDFVTALPRVVGG